MDSLTEEALKLVKPAKFFEGFYLPNYQRNIFMVLPTVYTFLGFKVRCRKTLLSNRDIKRQLEYAGCFDAKYAIVILLDSLGFQQVRYSKILNKAIENGNLILLSSVFPTVTSTALASIHTGYPPEEHGFVGHKIFIPEIGNIVNILNMCTLEAHERDILPSAGVNVRAFLWQNTVYEDVNEEYSHIRLIESSIAKSGLSRVIIDDLRKSIGYYNVIDCFSMVREILKKYREKKVFLEIYIGLLDELAHKYGPNSHEYMLGLHLVENNLLRLAYELKDEICDKTVVIIFSDHGQVELEEKEVIKFKKMR